MMRTTRKLAHSAVLWWTVAMGSTVPAPLSPLMAQTPAPAPGSVASGSDRLARFEVTEGTAMNVDVSPDGTTLVFDLLGDLYTMPVTGGPARRLTSGPAFDTEPVFSPDGRTIAFTSDRSGSENVWLMDADGRHIRAFTHETTTPVTGPEWLTAGEFRLVARKADAYWLYRADGDGVVLPTRLPPGLPASVGLAGWSREGRLVYVGVGRRLWSVDLPSGAFDLVANLQGAEASDFRPRLSPDGQWLVFARNHDGQTGLRLRHLATQTERWLINPLPEPSPQLRAVPLLPRFTFLPDGRALVLATGGTFQRVDLRTGARTPIRFRALVEQVLPARVAATPRSPALPDSARAIHDVQRDRAGRRTVFSALGTLWLQEGAGPARPLVEVPAALRPILLFEPALSPDGKHVAYVSWHDSAQGQLWRVPVAGGRPQQLTQRPGVYRHPVWSADGTRLAVMREDEAGPKGRGAQLGGELYVLPATGGPLQYVGPSAAEAVPQFTADGQQVRAGDRATPPAGDAPAPAPALPWPPRPRPDAAGRALALEGATVLTMRGDEVLRDATVVVTGRRITAVGPRATVPLPPGTRRIDMRGKTILPGLIDLNGTVPLARDGLEATNRTLAAYLAFGVTTVRAVPSGVGTPEALLRQAAEYRARLETGVMTGARLLPAGALEAAAAARLTDLEAARAWVRQQQALGATALVQRAALVRRQRQWLAQAAREAGLALVGESGELAQALTMLSDGYHTLQGTIPNARLYEDVRRFVAAAPSVYVPTLLAATGGHRGYEGTAEEYFRARFDLQQDPTLRRFGFPVQPARWRVPEAYHFPALSRQAARLAAHGAPVAVGTGGVWPGLGVHWELWALARGGRSAHATLRVATATAAAALGLARELGTLEPGKRADLVVLDADPRRALAHSRAARYVMRDGVLYTAATLAEVWPRATGPLPLRDSRYDAPLLAAVRPAERRTTPAAAHRAALPAGTPTMGMTAARPAAAARSAAQRTLDSLLPTRPARTIAFETTEVSRADLDLSPDGRTLVFALLGDIYTLPVTGGVATQLTRGLAWDQHPVWSPDGARIAYVSDGTGGCALWVMAADGSGSRPVTGEGRILPYDFIVRGGDFERPEWSPDGQNLLSRDSLFSLVGRQPVPAGLPGPARFSRDGRYATVLHDQEILWYELATGTSRLLARPPVVALREPLVSPDGRWLVYFTSNQAPRDGLRVRNLETGEDRWLFYPLEAGEYGRRVVFTPDSRAVLLSQGGQLHRIDVATGADALIPFRARAEVDVAPFVRPRRRLTNDSLLPLRYLRWPTVSPDGSTLVFTALRRLYTMALPRGTPRRLVAQELDQFHSAYSPDGRWVAYVTWSDTAGGHLWRVPAAGGPPERLTAVPGYYERPSWSPDGTLLAIVKRGPKDLPSENALWDWQPGLLQLVPSAGGPARAVYGNVAVTSAVTFTSDGQRLLFQEPAGALASADTPLGALVSTGLDGRDRRVVAQPPPGCEGLQIVPSPDGRLVVYSCDPDHLLLAPVPGLARPVVLEHSLGRGPIVQLLPGLDPRWDPDGKRLTWISGSEVYRLEPERALAEAFAGPRHSGSAGAPPPRIRPHEVITAQVAVPRRRTRGTLALRGARVITMRGDEVLEAATVVITDDRITAVGPVAAVAIPAGATVLDVRGKTIMPGLIDMHAHFRSVYKDHPDFFQHRADFAVNLAYGVTTAREVSGRPLQFEAGERIEAGDLLGPRLMGVGRGTSSAARLESLDDVRLLVRHLKRMGAVLVKDYEQPTRRRRQWVVQAAAEESLTVVAHPKEGIEVDGYTGLEHGGRYGLQGDLVRLAAETKMWYTPTLMMRELDGNDSYFRDAHWYRDPKFRRFMEPLDKHRSGKLLRPGDRGYPVRWLYVAQAVARIVHHGGHVTAGSHGDDPGIGMHWELQGLHLGGLSPHEALRAATLHGAEGLGVEQDLGSIEVGKLADLLVLDRNPLADIRHTRAIRYVMKNGELYDGETLATLWPTRRAPPR